MANIIRKIWGGALEYEDDDTPADVRAFNDFGKSTVLWLEQSRELYRASLYIMEERPRKPNEITHPRQAPIALMLGAYAGETLLKMVVVADHCEKHGVTPMSRYAKEFLPKTHNLVDLVAKAALRINKGDRNVLGELTRYSLWAGRYPIPLHFLGYEGPAIFEAISPAPAPLSPQHPLWQKYKTLYPKLHSLAVRRVFKGRGIILKPIAKTRRSK